MADSQRQEFLVSLAGEFGKPYIWGGKDGDPGWDCSGLWTGKIHAMGGPDWREKNCQMLFDGLTPIAIPDLGDACLFGSVHHVVHLMIWWGGGRLYGASRGDHTITTVALALANRASVKFKPVGYRPDFLGYRAAPFLPSDKEVSNA